MRAGNGTSFIRARTSYRISALAPEGIMVAKIRFIAFLLCAAVVGTVAQSKSSDPSYQQSVDKWKSELVEGRKNNWLPLAGLFWLKPGENTFGSDPKNAFLFPKGPAKAGSFELNGTDVT